MKTRVSIRGHDAIGRGLAATADGVADLRDEMNAAGRAWEGDAQRAAPRRSGRLAGSIEAEAGRDELSLRVGAPYAGVQEWGWRARGIKPQPYAWPAFEQTSGALIDDIADRNERLVRRIRGA